MARGFVSDNCAPVHPEVMQALMACNQGHAPSYDGDEFCASARKAFDALFERPVRAVFCFNGTGANVLSLALMTRPFQSVVCAACAHINVDETGAPERLLGCKLQTIDASDGKLTPGMIAPLLTVLGVQHHAQPRVISITNVTEMGAVYTPDEVRALADFAHANGLLLHMDGARIANAVVASGCSMAEMTWRAGLDVLSFGGAKNGLMFGEAVLFFRDDLGEDALFVRKNVTQLHSKSRYIGAQYEALLRDGLWRRNAEHANAMAKKLEAMLRQIDGVEVVHPAQANMMFARMPEKMAQAVCENGFGAQEYGLVRLVTAFDTEMEEIEALKRLAEGSR